mmetsp:Transcript_74885/g.216493  ORF Transcript_74885/g.216493 Transcript_74885/m.216493 type:complete len:193 (+) Transcript_74885:69-647(+)
MHAPGMVCAGASLLLASLAPAVTGAVAPVAPRGATTASLMRLEDGLPGEGGCASSGKGRVCPESCGKCLRDMGVTRSDFKEEVYDKGLSTALFGGECKVECGSLTASISRCSGLALGSTWYKRAMIPVGLTGCGRRKCSKCLKRKNFDEDSWRQAAASGAEVKGIQEACPKDCSRYVGKITRWIQQVEKKTF